MFFTCSSSCSDPSHQHLSNDYAQMMATKTTQKVASNSQAASLAKSKNSQKKLPATQQIVKNSKNTWYDLY